MDYKNCLSATCYLMNDNKVMLLWHKKLEKWMPPGGHLEENENPIQTVHREVLEETGYRIKLVDTNRIDSMLPYIIDSTAQETISPMIVLLETINYSTEVHKHFDMNYLALVDTENNREIPEYNQIKWFDRNEIDSLETFDNVKFALHRAFEIYTKYKLSFDKKTLPSF